jgi:hypothetical protein
MEKRAPPRTARSSPAGAQHCEGLWAYRRRYEGNSAAFARERRGGRTHAIAHEAAGHGRHKWAVFNQIGAP